MKTLRVPIRWTDQHAIKYSLLLAVMGYVLVIIVQIAVPNKPRVGLPDFLGAYSFIAAALGFVVPQISLVIKRIFIVLLPRPGALIFDKSTTRELSESFEFDRTRLAAAMVPDHMATAQPARSSQRIDLGDAALVLDETQNSTIRQFIGHPKRLAPIRYGSAPERNVLMITGEPGAGKSVLIQEIHTTLTTGIENGYHSFIPVLLFARDLTLDSLEVLLDTHSEPMQGLLVKHYESLLKNHPLGSQLSSLYQIVSAYWKPRDLLIIIDGLDEIAQRSAYERIQTALAKMIQMDLDGDSSGTHRYILTCRTDEDLEIFNKARCIRLKGLNENSRHRFCTVLLRSFELSRGTKNSLERALRSRRLVPSHVFGRNPYFLALLIRHLKDDQDHVRQETIDFDFLMRRYLEREAVRPHAAVGLNRQYSTEERHHLFNELEKLSRAPLQYLAFHSAISAQTGALYDEKPIDGQVFRDFYRNIAGVQDLAAQTVWTNLKGFFKQLNKRSPNHDLIINASQLSSVLDHLHENDIRIMSDVAQAVHSRSTSSIGLIEKVLGRIRVLALAETEEWYEEFALRFASVIDAFSVTHRTTALFFIRGIAAAHLLRILNVSFSPTSVLIRFRHRRLAEYYAACYARDRWEEVEPSLALTPWINPVLNLTAALEGPRSLVFLWLVSFVEGGPQPPLFKWRYVVESAVEASFFSEPSTAYQAGISRLSTKLIQVLRNQTPWSVATNDANTSLDPVTETALLRALSEIASLKPTFRTSPISHQVANQFYQYQNGIGPEWMGLIVDASSAVERLSNTRQPMMVRLKTLWRLIEQPLPMVLERAKMFSSHPILGCLVFCSMILSEVVLLALVLLVSLVVFQFVANRLGATPEDSSAALKFVVCIALTWRTLSRIQSWMKSPMDAAMKAARVWRFAGNTQVMFYDSLSKVREGLSLRRLAKITAAFVVLGVVLVGAGLVLEFGSKLTPCPELQQPREKIQTKYSNVPRNLTPAELLNLRVQLRDDLAVLRATNTRGCGFREDDGTWVLTEERVIDELIKTDERLIPAPDPSVSAWNNEDANLLNSVLLNTTKEPGPGLVGSLASISREREASEFLQNAELAKSRVIAARRAGVEDFGADKGVGKSASVLLTNLDEKIREQKTLVPLLRDRRNRLLLTAVPITLVCVMVPWLVVSILRQRRNQRLMRAVRATVDIYGLFHFVTSRDYSDKVRTVALERLEEIGIQNQDDLVVLETHVGMLYGSHNAIERSLAIRGATIARILSKRLSHKTSL